MMPLLGSGKLKTVIDRIFPLHEAAEAHRYLEAGKQFGKVVLRVEQ
jgi:NADPH:quinone reductase-like Zn-dependent oxidoreductase